jgi:hypothetical protein
VAAVPWILEVSKRHASSLGDIIYGHGKTICIVEEIETVP